MVGFDYIRFGGDPVTYTYNYDYYDENDPNDACHTNPGRMETETTPFAAYRGENQTIIYHDGWSYQGSAGTARTSMALKPRWTLRERWWNGG